ncbi:hypothetical protein SH2C18_46980 [Clostridium sediminicola]|uniref:hypothetical protein n=1 Tax=Clostridium sediminicola TaxID=3114879 RepID=UPI0031F1FE3C
MKKKIWIITVLIIMFIYPKAICAPNYKYVEIFNPKQDKVVKVVQLTPEINDMISNWVMNIENFYGNLDPITDDGYAIKIPFNSSVQVETDVLNANIKEVFILIPENELPFYLVFENNDKVSCFAFNGDIEELSRALDFKLK